MTTMYLYDSLGNYTGSQEHIKYSRLPNNYTEIAPPDGQFAVWVGNQWELRDAPVVPPPPSPPVETIESLKEKLVETDYVGLTDYDKQKPELLAQRQQWREAIRALDNQGI